MIPGLWVDWSGSGFGSTAYDNLSALVTAATYSRGGTPEITGAAQPGQATFTVQNPNGLFDPDNAAGPLYYFLKDGKRVWWGVNADGTIDNKGATVYGRFAGRITEIAPLPVPGARGSTPTAQIVCEDALGWYGRTPVKLTDICLTAPVPPGFHQVVLVGGDQPWAGQVPGALYSGNVYTAVFAGGTNVGAPALPPAAQDTDSFAVHTTDGTAPYGYVVSSVVIPALLGGTYQAYWEQINTSPPWLVGSTPQAVPYVPSYGDTACGAGVGGPLTITYKLRVNGAEVLQSAVSSPSFEYFIGWSHGGGTFSCLPGDIVTFTIETTVSIGPAMTNSIGFAAFAEPAGVLALTRLHA